MPYTPTRAQVIDAALAEYVERHGKPKDTTSAHSRHAAMVKAAKKSPPPPSWFEEDTKELRGSKR
ncbi:MAG TPA: hypothetical protein VFC46_10745 [Humisphaera sp.]|nr:hypothetical protein [Humisphaera sp.]